MGHWGTGIYDNDGALDWCSSYRLFGSEDFIRRTFVVSKDAPPVRPTSILGRMRSSRVEEFHVVLDPDAVLAAADTVASILGSPSKTEKRPVRRTVKIQDRSIVDLAIESAEFVRDQSYRREGWITEEKRTAWIATINDLVGRLGETRG